MDLKKLTESLIGKAATVQSISAQVGAVQEHQEGAGYDLKPNDPSFSHAFLGIDDAPTGEAPRYLTLTIAPGARMSVQDLGALFGSWRSLPSRGQEPPAARFKYDRAEFPWLGFVQAYVSSDADDPTARVEKIMILREERLD